MRLIAQLFNDTLGSVIIKNGPGGLDSFSIERKRDKKSDGFIYEFSVNLDFVKEGKAFVQQVYETFGPDGICHINIYSEDINNYKYRIEYEGQLQLDNYTIDEEMVTTNVEPVGFQRKFLNLQKRAVSMDVGTSRGGTVIGNTARINLPLKPKTIKKQAFLKGPSGWIESGYTPGFASYIRLGGELTNTDFGTDKTFLGVDSWVSPDPSTEIPPDVSNYVLDVAEAGNYVVDLSAFTFDLFIEIGNVVLGEQATPNLTSWNPKVYYQKNDGPAVELFNETYSGGGTYNLGDPPPPGDFDTAEETDSGNKTKYTINDLSLAAANINDTFAVGDEIYIWFDSDVDFVGAGDSSKNVAYRLRDDFEFTITGDTIFPETVATSFLIYEFLEHIVQYYTDQVDSFVSDYFGRTDLGYAVDGPGSMLVVTNGRAIRQLQNETVYGSWEDAFESVNALHCLGWSFEKQPDGSTVIRVEPKSYFFDKNTKAIELTEVSKLKKMVEIDLLYSEIKVGYPKVENINQVNGIDEFNSQRIFASPLTNVTQELDIRSVYRASGFEIESQRRLIGSTEESKLDDENFFICVKRNGSGGYEVVQGSDFESVTGVFDPDTAYNLPISPAHNLRRWGQILASNVIRSINKTFQFTYGDYNYLVSSKMAGEDEIFENGDFDLSEIEPFYYTEIYTFEAKAGKQERDLIDAGINGYCVGPDWGGNEFEGYFLRVRSILSEQKGDLRILRLYRPEE